jgi:hypothetical protein
MIYINPCKAKRGHNEPPPGKNIYNSFASHFIRPSFSEKKINGRRNFGHRKKIEKKIWGIPQSTELSQNLMKI